MLRILPVVMLLAACRESDRRPPPVAQKPPALEHATQADLAREVADADRLGTWREVQHRWEGQTLTWNVTRKPVLCHSSDFCVVAAFPMQRPAKQGWMPQLQFAPGQYAALDAACGTERDCDVTVEGTLTQLTVSPELPTNVQLANVRIVKVNGPKTAAVR